MTTLAEDLGAVFARFDADEGGDKPEVRAETINDVVVVELRNPRRRNALTLAMWSRLADIFESLRWTTGLSAIVIRGAGIDAFAAGADISEFAALRSTVESAGSYNVQISRALEAIAHVGVPTVAAIRGFAVGGGCELSHACDLRIAANDARIGIPIGKLGVILGPTEAKYLVRQVGAAGLKRILLSARLFNAQESLRMRLVDDVVATEELWQAVIELVVQISESRPVTARSSILVADHAAGLVPSASFAESMLAYNNIAYGTAGLAEGFTAFLDKRIADFSAEKELF